MRRSALPERVHLPGILPRRERLRLRATPGRFPDWQELRVRSNSYVPRRSFHFHLCSQTGHQRLCYGRFQRCSTGNFFIDPSCFRLIPIFTSLNLITI